jgi:hypothetical protein
MREQRLWRDTSRFSLSAQMIVMVLVLALVAMILVKTWAGIIATSRRTEALNKGVLLCRSAAEVYTREADLSAAAQALGGAQSKEGDTLSLGFDREMKTPEGEDPFLTLELSEPGNAEQGLHSCELVVRQDGKELYRMTVKTFAPGKGA